MKSIFEQLWNGHIKPYETNGINDPEVEELSELMERNQKSLKNTLDEGQKQALDQYISCCESYYYLLVIHAFRQGFSLAGKLLAEALLERE